MGILRKGIFNGFENKTAGLVGRRINGNYVLSAPPHKSLKPQTLLQLDQQIKFAMVTSFLKRFVPLISSGFKTCSRGNAFNAAVKYNFNRLITGTSTNYSIDYSKLVYSKGSLDGPNSPTLTVLNNVLLLRWFADIQTQYNRYTDMVSFAIYCPHKKLTIIYKDEATRFDLGCSLTLPAALNNEHLHCFMSFESADRKMVSNSVYLGTIN